MTAKYEAWAKRNLVEPWPVNPAKAAEAAKP
jgi:hypothetical protein